MFLSYMAIEFVPSRNTLLAPVAVIEESGAAGGRGVHC